MITKIQSFTDVITNSSSTVFVMHERDANYYDKLEHTEGCVDIEPITFEWLLDNSYEFKMVCELIGCDVSEISKYIEWKYWSGWNTPNSEDWRTFLELHREKIEKVFKDLYLVEIEDHFEEAFEVTENAYDDAIWTDYRH